MSVSIPRRSARSALLVALAVAGRAFAQEGEPPVSAGTTAPSTELAVEIEPGAGGFAAVQLRDAIAREAGVRVTDATSASGPRLIVRGAGAHGLTFRLVGAGDHDAERSIELPEGSASKQLSIAGLVAASLMEDDAAELLARLRAEAKKAAAPPPAAAPAPPGPPVRRAERTPLVPCTAPRPDLERTFGADVLPRVGMSKFEPAGTYRHISLELLGGGMSGVIGLEFSPLTSFNPGTVCGVQLSAFGNWSCGGVRGVTLSGFVGWADRVEGVQAAAFVTVSPHTVRGLQLSAVALAREIQGMQFAPVSIAGDVHGLQLGVVNVARTSDASVGVISLVVQGRTNVQAFATTNAVTSIAVQHGSRLVHNFYGGSVSAAGKNGVAFGPLIGIGVHAYENADWFLDFDLMAHVLFGSGGTNPEALSEARLVAGWRLSSGFAIYAGPAFDVLQVHTGQERRALDGLVLKKTVATGDGTLHLSPALVAGVRGL